MDSDDYSVEHTKEQIEAFKTRLLSVEDEIETALKQFHDHLNEIGKADRPLEHTNGGCTVYDRVKVWYVRERDAKEAMLAREQILASKCA